ncbi:MAG: hypothetical protein IPM21_18280 [Acidobacteria bacterium]|nr:hypothetical protein [Acidobacteriota bacterium]
MNASLLIKGYNVFAVLYCLAISLIAIVTFILPLDGYFIGPPYDEQKRILYTILLMVLAALVVTPQPVSLIGYCLAGGIGKRRFSGIVFRLLIMSLCLAFFTILYLIYINFTIVPADKIGETIIQTDLAKALLFFLIVSSYFLFPLTLTIAALIVQKVSLWKRLLPIISLLLSLVVVAFISAALYAIGTITRSENMYSAMQGATIPQFAMLGSAAWALIGLVVVGMPSGSPQDN